VAELRAHLAEWLPDYMQPTYFIRLDKLPLTSNGKIDRQVLPDLCYENIQPAQDFVGPQTDTEKALAAIWAELLNVRNIGINNDFLTWADSHWRRSGPCRVSAMYSEWIYRSAISSSAQR